MGNLISSLIGAFVIVGLALLYYNSKKHAIDKICDHPELSDDKVKSITKMMTIQFRKNK